MLPYQTNRPSMRGRKWPLNARLDPEFEFSGLLIRGYGQSPLLYNLATPQGRPIGSVTPHSADLANEDVMRLKAYVLVGVLAVTGIEAALGGVRLIAARVAS
jgi:hypothetical protein